MQNANYSPPYIGQTDAKLTGYVLNPSRYRFFYILIPAPPCHSLIPFTNVAEGDMSTIWTLNSTSGALSGMSTLFYIATIFSTKRPLITAQWTNPDGSKPDTYILYNKSKTQLVFSNTDEVEGAEVVVSHHACICVDSVTNYLLVYQTLTLSA